MKEERVKTVISGRRIKEEEVVLKQEQMQMKEKGEDNEK